MLDINYYLRGAAGLLQKSRLATTSLPFSSSYAYSIYLDNHDFSYARILKTSREEGKGQGGRGKGVGKRPTSLVEECNMRMFLAVMICTKALVSKLRISIKLGSNAKRYGWLSANVCGRPSQQMSQSGRARQPCRLTKNEYSE